MKKLAFIFLIAFLLNLVWEKLHSYLYLNYQGGPITDLILLRAALIDALIIMMLSLLFLYVGFFRKKQWLIIPAGIIVAVIIEIWALSADWWQYNNLMPIIPLFNVGLTPIIQLGLLGYFSIALSYHYSNNGA